jgi:hypothetical protein
MSTEMITDDGVVIKQMIGPPPTVDTAMAGALARAEIDTQVATAKRYPRSIKTAINNILSLATLDEETATECIYALKRSGKPIRGPSIRLAEIVCSQWGNCRDTAMVVSIDRVNKLVTAEGAFHDLETNRATRASVQRRISGKDGRLFSDDMIAVTGNAACSIARRNAILAGVPKGIWRKAVEACEQIIRGDASTMVEKRDKAMAALAHFNLSPEQVFKIMDVQGLEDLSLDDIATLRVIYTSLKNGEQTVEELLRQIEPEKPQRVTAANANMSAPAHFESDGLPTADAGTPAPAASKPAPTVEQSKPALTPTKAQPTLALEPDTNAADDMVLGEIRTALSNAKTPAKLAAVWKQIQPHIADDIDRAISAKSIYDQAQERLGIKQAAE